MAHSEWMWAWALLSAAVQRPVHCSVQLQLQLRTALQVILLLLCLPLSSEGTQLSHNALGALYLTRPGTPFTQCQPAPPKALLSLGSRTVLNESSQSWLIWFSEHSASLVLLQNSSSSLRETFNSDVLAMETEHKRYSSYNYKTFLALVLYGILYYILHRFTQKESSIMRRYAGLNVC